MTNFDFGTLRMANMARVGKFKSKSGEPAHKKADGSDWDVFEWLMALIGEVGEACEARIAYENGDLTEEAYTVAFGKELADIQCYLDLVAARGLDKPAPTIAGNPTEARIVCHMAATLGDIGNRAKKVLRGDMPINDYVAMKAKLARRMRVFATALERSGNRASGGTKEPHPFGVDLGAATVAKWNEVSARVGLDMNIRPYLRECGECGWRDQSSYKLVTVEG